MKIHSSSPWKTLPIRSAVFAVLISLAVHAQAQQNSIGERQEKTNRSERAENRLHELFGTTQLSGEDLDPEFFEIMKRFTCGWHEPQKVDVT
jgi:hypothetical protein